MNFHKTYLYIFIYLLGTPLLWRLLNYRKFRCEKRMSVYLPLGETETVTTTWLFLQHILLSFSTSYFLGYLFLSNSLSLTFFDFFSALMVFFPRKHPYCLFLSWYPREILPLPNFLSWNLVSPLRLIPFLISTSHVVLFQVSCHWKLVLQFYLIRPPQKEFLRVTFHF